MAHCLQRVLLPLSRRAPQRRCLNLVTSVDASAFVSEALLPTLTLPGNVRASVDEPIFGQATDDPGHSIALRFPAGGGKCAHTGLHGWSDATYCSNGIEKSRGLHGWSGTTYYGNGTGRPPGSSEYDLSLGKIVDTLRRDYPAMFEREPEFGIYHDAIEFKLGQPFHGVLPVRGKRAYRRSLAALHRLACRAVRDGTVTCSVYKDTYCGYDLKVHWTCRGHIRLPRYVPCYGDREIFISANSLYALAEAPAGRGMVGLAHKINRHTIDFLDIQPPSLRSLLQSLWWQPQLKHVAPALAFNQTYGWQL